MRNLLWKDFWQNSRVLLAVAVAAACPYVLFLTIAVVQSLYFQFSHVDITSEYNVWAGAIEHASVMSLLLSILMAAFLGGNAIAGERADRSAEFAACLPMSRGKSVASKATVAGISCLVLWAINAAACVAAWKALSQLPLPRDDMFIILHSLAGIALLLGLAWLYSSLLSSPAISAAAGIGTAIVLFVAVQTICPFLTNKPMREFLWMHIFFCLAPAIGVLSFAAGVKICLIRTQP